MINYIVHIDKYEKNLSISLITVATLSYNPI